MNFIYFILKPLVRLALYAYFRKVVVLGREQLPSEGPAILVANHPSAFLDPLLVTVHTKKPIYYLAAAEFFGNRLQSWIFRKLFHMIPVYRPEKFEDVNQEEMFNACYKALESGKIILMFPEGNSRTEHRLRKLKTGAVRIKIGAEKYMGQSGKVPLIPVGINYTNPHQFQSNVTMSIGRPVSFRITSEENSVREMTARLAEAMEEHLWVIDDPELDEIANKVQKVFRHSLLEEMEEDDEIVTDRRKFRLQKNLFAAIGYFSKKDPEKVARVNALLDDYLTRLDEEGIRDPYLTGLETRIAYREYFSVIFGGLIAVPSLLISYLPYLFTRMIFRSKILPGLERDEIGYRDVPAFAGSLAFAMGFLIYLIWYTSISITLHLLFDTGWWSAGVVFLLYFMGLYSLRWIRLMARLRSKRILRNLIDNNRRLFSQLLIEREKIMEVLEESRDEYVMSKDN